MITRPSAAINPRHRRRSIDSRRQPISIRPAIDAATAGAGAETCAIASFAITAGTNIADPPEPWTLSPYRRRHVNSRFVLTSCRLPAHHRHRRSGLEALGNDSPPLFLRPPAPPNECKFPTSILLCLSVHLHHVDTYTLTNSSRSTGGIPRMGTDQPGSSPDNRPRRKPAPGLHHVLAAIREAWIDRR